MRQFIALTAAAALSAFAADASAQSRYGPRPTPTPMDEAPVARVPGVALLTWAGKAPTALQHAQAPGVQRPEPMAPWAQRMAGLAPEPARLAAAPQPAAPQPRAALPSNLYDTQAPAPVAPAPPAPRAPTPLLGAAPSAPAQAYGAPSGPRFYSVFREYGLAPDQIPVAPAPGRGAEVELRELPQTPSLAGQDDTQYVPPRPNGSQVRDR